MQNTTTCYTRCVQSGVQIKSLFLSLRRLYLCAPELGYPQTPDEGKDYLPTDGLRLDGTSVATNPSRYGLALFLPGFALQMRENELKAQVNRPPFMPDVNMQIQPIAL